MPVVKASDYRCGSSTRSAYTCFPYPFLPSGKDAASVWDTDGRPQSRPAGLRHTAPKASHARQQNDKDISAAAQISFIAALSGPSHSVVGIVQAVYSMVRIDGAGVGDVCEG